MRSPNSHTFSSICSPVISTSATSGIILVIFTGFSPPSPVAPPVQLPRLLWTPHPSPRERSMPPSPTHPPPPEFSWHLPVHHRSHYHLRPPKAQRTNGIPLPREAHPVWSAIYGQVRYLRPGCVLGVVPPNLSHIYDPTAKILLASQEISLL